MSDDDPLAHCSRCYEELRDGDTAYRVKKGRVEWTDTSDGPGPIDRMPAYHRTGSPPLDGRSFLCPNCIKKVIDEDGDSA